MWSSILGLALAGVAASMLGGEDLVDPLDTDPDKYSLVFENDRVRVLEYRDKPGEKTKRHHHHDFVLYALSSFERRLVLGDGRTLDRRLESGETIWMDAQSHIGENTGSTETHVLIVERLEPRPDGK